MTRYSARTCKSQCTTYISVILEDEGRKYYSSISRLKKTTYPYTYQLYTCMLEASWGFKSANQAKGWNKRTSRRSRIRIGLLIASGDVVFSNLSPGMGPSAVRASRTSAAVIHSGPGSNGSGAAALESGRRDATSRKQAIACVLLVKGGAHSLLMF